MKHALRFTLLILLLSSVSAYAQLIPYWAWAHQSQGSSYEDASAVAATNSDVYVTGYYANDTCVFGNDTLYNNGSTDFYLIRYDEFGTLVWSVFAGGSGDEYGMDVDVDAGGNVVVTGNYSSASVTFGAFTLTNLSPGTPDMFVVKYDPNGNVLWAVSEGGADWDNASGIVVDPLTDDIYVSAAYYNAPIEVGTDSFPNNGGYDLLLMKFDANGNNIWSRNAGGNFNDLANSVAVDNAGNVYISGGFASDTLIFTGNDTLVNAFGSIPDIFTVRYTSNGDFVWARRAGSNDNDHSVSVCTDWNGQVYVVGHYHSTSFMFDTTTLTNMGMGDVFLLVYDTLGNALWAKSFGGTDHDFGYAGSSDGQRVVITGMFMSMSMMAGNEMLMNNSMNEDAFLVTYSPSGYQYGAMSFGGNGREYFSAVDQNISGMLYVCGSFSSTTVTCTSQQLNNSGTTGTSDALFGRMDYPMNFNDPIRNNVRIFPNPSGGIFNFSSESPIESVAIYSATGALVHTQPANGAQNCALDLSQYSEGVYFYRVITADGQSSGLVVRQD